MEGGEKGIRGGGEGWEWEEMEGRGGEEEVKAEIRYGHGLTWIICKASQMCCDQEIFVELLQLCPQQFDAYTYKCTGINGKLCRYR